MDIKAVSFQEFFSLFPNEEACLKHVFDATYGAGKACPQCQRRGTWTYIKGTKKYLHNCRSHISVLAGTPFYRSNFSLLTVFYAMLLFANSTCGVRSSFLRKHLGLGTKSAHRLGNLIRLHMANLQSPSLLSHDTLPVEADEVYLQYFKSPHETKLQAKILMGFAHQGRVQCGFIKNRTREVIEKIVLRNVSLGQRIFTDQFASYAGLRSLGYRHEAVNHSKGEFYRLGITTANIDTCWAAFRRTFRLYHQIGIENGWLYLAEAQFRYNFRNDPRGAFHQLISCWPPLLPSDEIQGRFEWT